MTGSAVFHPMKSYTFYIDDDRSAFPVRLPVEFPDGAAVREQAEALLNGSKHYRAIEVFAAATRLFRVGERDFSLGRRR
jgi:hypothetical protein